MIITLSPAKLIDFDTPVAIKEETEPRFAKQANELIGILNKLTIEEMASLMEINPKQAMTVYQQIHAFHLDKTPRKQAAYAYNGIAYSGLDMKSLTPEETVYAQEHLVILSGLYGALRPLDIIKPYRLEMQARLQNKKGETLYEYWVTSLTKYLTERLNKDDKLWLNLMSSEYTKTINRKQLPKGITVITPVFKQQISTGYKQIVVHTKKARGMMARFVIKHQINDLEHLKTFDEEGYMFSEQLSNEKEWVFVR